jgi:hypothetical protein
MQHVTRKHLCHTASDKEKPPKPKKERNPQTILWCPVNRHTHIKREDEEAGAFSSLTRKTNLPFLWF